MKFYKCINCQQIDVDYGGCSGGSDVSLKSANFFV